MKTRREKLEELVKALKLYMPIWFDGFLDFPDHDKKAVVSACLALSEPDAPEQTADDVIGMWEDYAPGDIIRLTKGYWPTHSLQQNPFAAAYREWKSKQKPAKVPVFEITTELKQTIANVLYGHETMPVTTLVHNVAVAIQAATAKELT